MSMGIVLMVIGWLILLAVTFWVGLALLCANLDLGVLYKKLPNERYAFVIKGGQVVKIIWNSKTRVLIFGPGCSQMGILVKTNEVPAGCTIINKPGFFEEMLGIRWIGLPFIHSLFKKKLEWYGIKDGKPIKREATVDNFAITKTFGFVLEGLTVGSDTNKTQGGDGKAPSQRLPVKVRFMGQVYTVDPYRSIIASEWTEATLAMMFGYVQTALGMMDLDELIKVVDAGNNNQLEKAVAEHLDEIQQFGVEFNKEEFAYVDFELEGELSRELNEASVAVFKAKELAKAKETEQKAGQAGAEALAETITKTVKQLMEGEKGLTHEEAVGLANGILMVQGRAAFKGNTLVEGGGNNKITIPMESEKKRG